MNQFNNTGKLGVDKAQLGSARQDFLAASCSEQQTIEYIAKFDKEHKYTLDPHTACGVAAVDELRSQMAPEGPKHKIVVLGTAHPAKFSMAVAKAIGSPPTLPKGLDNQGADVRFQVLPAKFQTTTTKMNQQVRNSLSMSCL